MILMSHATMGTAGYQQAASSDWWRAGGAPAPIAVWQPKGAASLADSYLDLSGNEHHATPVVAPAFTAEGWVFDGSSSFLSVPTLIPVNDGTWSIATRVRDVLNRSTDNYLFGQTNNEDTAESRFAIIIRPGIPATNFLNGDVGSRATASVPNPMSVAMTSYAASINGGTTTRSDVFTTNVPCTHPLGIGGTRGGGTFISNYIGATVAGLALYNQTLTQDQLNAVTQALSEI
jgi:hypothetical protein